MKPIKNSRGIAIIYVTLFLMVLGLLFFALGIDVGWLAYVRSQGQTAVDAGALSGAAAIPNYNATADPGTVYTMVSDLNDSNTVMHLDASNTVIQSAELSGSNVEFCTGLPGSPTCTSATIPADGIRVTKPYTAPLYFGKLFKNGDTADLTVSAIAWLGGPGALRPDLPVALCSQQIGYTENPDGTYSCVESLDTDLTPNNEDNAGWWAFETSASSSECKQMVTGAKEVPYTQTNDVINLNNGEITACHKEIEKRFADAGCFTPRITEPVFDENGNKIGEIVIQEGVPGTQCDDPAADPELVKACTVTLPVVNCPNSINQQQPIIGYASVCIKYIQSNPASSAVISTNLECNVTVDAPGGGLTLGTYASRPVLVK